MPKQFNIEEISLEFVRKTDADEPNAFSFERQEYYVLHTYGDSKTACFPWDDSVLQAALGALEKSNPASSTLEKIGNYLRRFLDTTNWARDEDAIERAWRSRRPIHITIRSNAAELYYLPWELLPLKSSGTQLGELPDCLIRYEWPRCIPRQSSHSDARILFACSAAGGGVPFEEHRRAILNACQSAASSSKVRLDVLPNVTRESLARELSDPTRPVTVLHVLCHGVPVRDDAYGFAFDPVDSEDKTDRLDATDLRRVISTCANPPRLVVLSVCQGGDVGRPARLLGSMAQTLHRQGIPAVIASRMPLSSNASVRLTEVLYGELLCGSGNLRTALSAARKQLMHQLKSKDWASLQLYARQNDDSALDPFLRLASLVPVPARPRKDLVIICHEAYAKAHAMIEPEDAPALFAERSIRRRIDIDQTRGLEVRNWTKLDAAVRCLVNPKGDLQRALREPDAELVYYGFPFIPLAALAGYLAKTRHVHVFEHERELGRFTWVREASGSFPLLSVEVQKAEHGSAAQLRLSISAPVNVEDCRAVLPEQDVKVDLHFKLEAPQRGIVRREEQVEAYTRQIRAMLDQHVVGRPAITSVHVFAAVPVSIAFRVGQALTATGLPSCAIYNYGAQETPRYKWRLWLRTGTSNRPSAEILQP